jgi:hypothetical protein
MNFSNNVNSISYEYRYPYVAVFQQVFGLPDYSWGPITLSISEGWQYRRWEGSYEISGPAGTLSSTFQVYNNSTLFLNITGTTNDYNVFTIAFRTNFLITSFSWNNPFTPI